MDVALESGQARQGRGLAEEGAAASRGDGLALVEGDGAERAAAETAPARDQGELDFREGWYAAFGLVHGMPGPLVGQLVEAIEFRAREWRRRRLLDDPAQIAGLYQGLRVVRIGVGVAQPGSLQEGGLVGGGLLVGRQLDEAAGSELGGEDERQAVPAMPRRSTIAAPSPAAAPFAAARRFIIAHNARSPMP